MPKIVATKNDWIKLGYKLFTESGASGLVVDNMSAILKCNKSSFYWHFKSRANFINSLVDYWVNLDTTDIIHKVNQADTPKDKLLSLISIVFRKDSNLDFIFHLKKYAQSDKQVKKLVDSIDRDRIKFVESLLVEMGYKENDAKIKAQIFYKYLIGYHEMIRYKRQGKHYIDEVLLEIDQFIKIK